MIHICYKSSYTIWLENRTGSYFCHHDVTGSYHIISGYSELHHITYRQKRLNILYLHVCTYICIFYACLCVCICICIYICIYLYHWWNQMWPTTSTFYLYYFALLEFNTHIVFFSQGHKHLRSWWRGNRTRHSWRMRHARGIANPLWLGKRSGHSRRMRKPRFYISSKRLIATIFALGHVLWHSKHQKFW